MGCRSLVVMPEQPVAIGEQIPDDDHIHHQHEEDAQDAQFRVPEHFGTVMAGRLLRVAAQQPVNFNGDEKGGFPNGQPDGPAGAKGQPHPHPQPQQAAHQGSQLRQAQVGGVMVSSDLPMRTKKMCSGSKCTQRST